MELKLAKELIRELSKYFANNRLNRKLTNPINTEYIDALKIKPLITFGLIDTSNLSAENTEVFNNSVDLEIARLENERSTDLLRFDLVMKGAMFLYLNEILSWKEVRVLLNLDYGDNTQEGIHLYKKEENDSLGAYDIILALLSVLFGKIVYEQSGAKNYNFDRLTSDNYYWDLPVYYYGYKAALSYADFNSLADNVDWFLKQFPELNEFEINEVLGMLRINNSFSNTILKENGIENIETELDNLPLYNIALNILKFQEWDKEEEINKTKYGMNNILFDFHRSIYETTKYTEDDINYTEIKWEIIEKYSLYIRTLTSLRYEKTPHPTDPFNEFGNIINNPFDLELFKKIEKINFILLEIQNFLIH